MIVTRIDRFVLRTLSLLLAVGLVVAASTAEATWPMFQSDAQHTGRSAAVGPLLNNLQWQFQLSGTPGSPAVGLDDVVFLPTGMVGIDAQSFLYAINPDGMQKWRVLLLGPPGSTAPGVAADGTIYVHTNGTGAPVAVEAIQAFNPADGSSKWSKTFNNNSPVSTSFVQSAPIVGPDGTIYVGSQDGKVYALNPADGSTKWSRATFNTISSSPALSPDGATVYLHDHSGLIAYKASDGSDKWTFPINVNGGTGSPSVGSDGTIYFAHVSNATLYAINPEGTLKWAQILGSAPVSTPALAPDGTIYAGANGLYALTATGTSKWRFSEALFSSASPVVGNDGTIYWRESSHLYALHPDGTISWQRTIPFPSLPGLDSTPAIGTDGTLYVPVVDPLDPLGQRLLAIRTCPADCGDGNPCTTDTCDPLSGCTHPNAADGSGCDDATVCNGHEVCVGGGCTGGSPLSCADTNPCTSDVCEAIAGCQHPNVTDGTPCPDSNVCNGTETCASGVCSPGPTLDCDDQNACTVDTCNVVSGCVHTPTPGCTPCQLPTDCSDGNLCTTDECLDGICRHSNLPDDTSCTDADFCNGAETCHGGLCFNGALPSCDDKEPCTADSCDPLLGCLHASVTDGTTCSNGNVCDGGETCHGGHCTAGTALNCNDGNPCTVDTCDAATGCKNARVNDGTLCADGNACNGTETCQAGACTAGTPLVCDDANVCTDDSCDPAQGCRNVDRPDGSSCANGTLCDGSETCQTGVCTPGPVLDCDDGKPCTLDSCNAVSGCINTPVAGCTACATTPDCDDGNRCTIDFCSGGSCQNVVQQDGASCSDNDACNGVETCSGGTCQAGTALNCDDGNPCTVSTCDPLRGCLNTPAADELPCPDTDLCNGGETCHNGVCTAGPFLDCDDHNPCTDDSCDAVQGCQHTNVGDGTTCADTTVCNGAETCTAGVCGGGIALDCDDDNPCTVDACNAISGCSNTPVAGCLECSKDADCNDHNPCTTDSCADRVCHNDALPDGSSCSDGSICNGAETCQTGQCVGATQPACDDQNGCTIDFCDPFAGCQHTSVANGASCHDADVCNGDETCHDGGCAHGAVLDCDDHDPCTDDSCDPVTGCQHGAPTGCDDGNPCTLDTCAGTGECHHVVLADGAACSDGDLCNGTETCLTGSCIAGTPIVCNDGNPCTIDSCDPSTGCQTQVAADGTPCTDATVCNGDETCLSGTCAPGTPRGCDDGDACTLDTCDPLSGCLHSSITGISGVACAFTRGLGSPACFGQKIPRSVLQRFTKAKALVAKAQKKHAAAAAKLLAQAAHTLKKAAQIAARAAHGKQPSLSAECADALSDLLLDAQGRAQRLVQ